MRNSEKSQSVRTVLLREWDPLIVGDNPHLSDEYDDYIPAIVRLLESHCTAEQLERHLTWIEMHDMGLPQLSGGISQAAKKLLVCWNAK
ncbi:MAG: hypothetical protein ACREDM_06060 [Methylocella sp.]